jgi:hypothetical protein
MGLKEDYQEKMEARIREWTAKINELKAEADRATADMKIKMQLEIDDLREKTEAVQKYLEEIRAASSEKWESLRAGAEKAMDEWKKKWDGLKSKYF